MKNFKKIIALLLALTLCMGLCASAFAFEAETAETKADALNVLGLFQGTDKGYELDRTPTRLEALIMLIRLTGKENDALYPWEPYVPHFTDMPTWEGAAEYICYAYDTGLTDGTSDTTFSPNEPATAQMFVTFALRALGYDAADAWDNWETLAAEAGLLVEGVNLSDFKRGDAVLVSAAALNAHVTKANCLNCYIANDGTAENCTECGYAIDSTLVAQLMTNGVFNELAYSIYNYTLGKEVTAESPLMDIYGKLYANLEDGPYLGALWPMPFTSEDAPYIIGAEGLDIVEAYACEPMMSSVAHSVCLIKMAEGSDIEAAKTAIRENVNPAKWICVSVDPENIRVESIGNLILLVMDNTHCDQIAENFLSLAK